MTVRTCSERQAVPNAAWTAMLAAPLALAASMALLSGCHTVPYDHQVSSAYPATSAWSGYGDTFAGSLRMADRGSGHDDTLRGVPIRLADERPSQHILYDAYYTLRVLEMITAAGTSGR